MAYTSPTQLNWQGPSLAIAPMINAGIYPPPAPGAGIGVGVGLWVRGPKAKPVLVCTEIRRPLPPPFMVRIPQPPMGKAAAVMLPAVYNRARDFPLKGQRYPVSR